MGNKKRVYTYTNDQGNVFWSLTRLPSVTNPGKRLTLQSRVGTYILNLLRKARYYPVGSRERRLFLRLASKEVPKDWLQFWKERYDKGKKKVPNTNPRTKARYPQVLASTLWRNDPAFREKVRREFQAWKGQGEQEDQGGRKDQDSEDKVSYEQYRLWLRAVPRGDDPPEMLRATNELRELLWQEQDFPKSLVDKAMAEIQWVRPRTEELGYGAIVENRLFFLEKAMEEVYRKVLEVPLPEPPEERPPTLGQPDKALLSHLEFVTEFGNAGFFHSVMLPEEFKASRRLKEIYSAGKGLQKEELDAAWDEASWAAKNATRLGYRTSIKSRLEKLLGPLESLYKKAGLRIPEVPEEAPPYLRTHVTKIEGEDWLARKTKSPVLGFRLPPDRHAETSVELPSEEKQGKMRAILGIEEDDDLSGILADLCGVGMVGGEFKIKAVLKPNNQIELKGLGPGVSFKREIIRTDDGEVIIHNNTLQIDDKGQGTGLRLLLGQVTAAHALGITRLECNAYCDPGHGWIGCKVWPKMGYDGEFKGSLPLEIEEDLYDQGLYPPWLVSQIRALPGGEEWWEENGESFDAVLKLSSDSVGMEVLRRYIKKRKARQRGL